MSMKGKTLVKGHTLEREDRVLKHLIFGSGPSKGVCSRGLESPEFTTTAARRRWHNGHQAAVTQAIQAQPTALNPRIPTMGVLREFLHLSPAAIEKLLSLGITEKDKPSEFLILGNNKQKQ